LSLHNPEIKLQSLKEDIKEFLKTSGWEKKLHNAVYREISMPLSEQKELLNKWNEMGTDEPDLSLFRPVYAPKDFLESILVFLLKVLMNLRNPNYDTSEMPNIRNHLGLIQVPLNVKDIPDLKEYFSELDLNTGQMDIDDSAHVPSELYENEHVRLGQKVLVEQDSAAAQQYVRQGSPNSLRAELWALILNISTQPEDVKLTASNDDYYFVFEDYLYQVLLCFSRDTSVLEHFAYNSASPPRSFIRGKLGMEQYAVFYPPNGVIPFHGFSMYVLAAAVFAFRAGNLMEVTSLAAAEAVLADLSTLKVMPLLQIFLFATGSS
ncbi:TBC1 domain family member 19, partial [Ophiophagus hannah]